MIDLDEAERLGRAATPGPWNITDPATIPPAMRFLFDREFPLDEADSEWCVYARNHWPEILEEIRDLRDKVEKCNCKFSY